MSVEQSQPSQVIRDRFVEAIFAIYDETFREAHGIYLDRGTSLFTTLESTSVEDASKPVGGNCASLAAQVKHVSFYLDVMDNYIQKKSMGKIDWGEIWRTTEAVTPEQWAALKDELREGYERVLARMKSIQAWEGENEIGGAIAIVAHTAYHLGEIRQALCILQPDRVISP